MLHAVMHLGSLKKGAIGQPIWKKGAIGSECEGQKPEPVITGIIPFLL